MAAEDRNISARLAKLGIGMLEAQSGLAALHAAMRQSSEATMLVSPIDWPVFLGKMDEPTRQIYGISAHSSSAATSWGEESIAVSGPGVDRHVRQPLSGPITHRVDFFTEVMMSVQECLGSDIAADSPLAQAGLDSIAALELRSLLESRLSLELPATL
eukprot:scaffold179305_cov48-Prasinocladus_malaysianus.AAC.1